MWVRGEIKGRGSFGLCADARRLGQGDLARGSCAGRVDKSVVGGILEWVKIWARVCCSRGVRGVCGLRIMDYIFLARIENRIAGRTRCGRIKK